MQITIQNHFFKKCFAARENMHAKIVRKRVRWVYEREGATRADTEQERLEQLRLLEVALRRGLSRRIRLPWSPILCGFVVAS